MVQTDKAFSLEPTIKRSSSPASRREIILSSGYVSCRQHYLPPLTVTATAAAESFSAHHRAHTAGHPGCDSLRVHDEGQCWSGEEAVPAPNTGSCL